MAEKSSLDKKYIRLQKELREKILGMYYKANAGHISCSLSCIDIMISVLFFEKDKEDVFLLSKGHAAAALYACLNRLGEISDIKLKTFYKEGTTLTAHPSPMKFKGIPFATGSLGHGFSIGTGIAMAKKLKEDKSKVFVLMSDGETNEGTTWEAAHFAVKHNLNNIIIIIDKNKIQGFGKTKDVLGDTAAKEKFDKIGFDAYEINGHNVGEIINVIKLCKKSKSNAPKVIIANTIKGKGVSYMENTVDWHYWPMDEKKYLKAIDEIKRKYIA